MFQGHLVFDTSNKCLRFLRDYKLYLLYFECRLYWKIVIDSLLKMNILNLPLTLFVDQPLLKISYDESKNIIYEGPLVVDAMMYNIKVVEYLNEDTIRFKYFDIYSLEKNHTGIVKKIDNIDSSNISSYLKDMVKIIKEYNPPVKNYARIYLKVYSEFKEFSKFYINLINPELSPDLSSIKVSFKDEAYREHSIEFGVDYNEKSDIFFVRNFDAPMRKRNISEMKSSNLKELFNIFLAHIEELQSFFEFMDVIDHNCIVIDPKHLRKLNYRRILIQKNFSVIITVDPFNMNSCPTFAFVGSDELVDEFQLRIQENLENWDNHGHLFEQLLIILGLERFPKELNTSDSQNNSMLRTDDDCSICFSTDLNGNVPDVVCDNRCCSSIYHRNCLFEWFSSIDSRKCFNNIQGPCPNCERTISCPIFN